MTKSKTTRKNPGIKRKSRTKGTNNKPAQAGNAFEVLGLILVALGLLLTGALLPLPTGTLGELLREVLRAPVGWGIYALPVGFLALGSYFLVSHPPKRWLRYALGYVVTTIGLWGMLAFAFPELTGRWGRGVVPSFAGAFGVLGFILTLICTLTGLDIFRGKTPLHTLKTGALGLFALLVGLFNKGAHTRRKLKSDAAFRADVALLRKRFKSVNQDLGTLGTLYAGSEELKKWQQELSAAEALLRHATLGTLREVEHDAKAWEEAVKRFTAQRAQELSAQIGDEGLRDFSDAQKELHHTLAEPLQERAIDGVRKSLGLTHLALQERYSKLLRERDQAAQQLKRPSPKLLLALSEAHHTRLERFLDIRNAQLELSTRIKHLEPWQDFMMQVLRFSDSYPHEHALETFYNDLKQTLKRHNDGLLQLAAKQQDFEALLLGLELSVPLSPTAPPSTSLNPAGFNLPASNLPDFEPQRQHPQASAATPQEEQESASSSAQEAKPAPQTQAEASSADPSIILAPADSAFAADFFADEDAEEAEGEDLPEYGGIPIQLPPLTLLDKLQGQGADPEERKGEVRARISRIDDTLANFRLQGRVVSSVRGPTVTRFEVEPAPGEKISRFANLSDDLALAMAVGSVRIEAPIPGKSVIGLEVPNAHRDLIRFFEAAASPAFKRSRARLPLILGKSIDGEMVIGDLAKMPHLLIAGSTGSGKSVAVNTLIGSLVYRFLPTEMRFLMIDPKMVELTPFDGIPHLLRPVVTNPNDAAAVLLGLVAHMERRYKMMSKIGAKNLDQYNEKARNLDLPELPFIAIIIDELADLMITSPKEVESAIMRLAQMARATGMHLILATQRPSVDILTSLIKVNVPARVAFAVSSSHDSRTILDAMGAERLTGMGDMLFNQPGLVKPMRLQGPFISEDEIFSLSSFLRRQYFDDEFVEAYGSDFDPPPLDDSAASGLVDWNDDKLRDAAEQVIADGYASVSRLQRRLSVGHARAGKLIDSLEALGIVGPHVGSKPREVLVELPQMLEILSAGS